MKHLTILVGMAMAISATARQLSTEPAAWQQKFRFFWQFDAKGMENRAGTSSMQPYVAAPLSRECSVEATVIPQKRKTTSWGVCGVALHHDQSNYWQFAMIDIPDALKDQIHPQFEMNEYFKDMWPYSDNYKVVEETRNHQWQYNTAYRLKLSIHEDILTASATTADGKLCYRKVVKLINPDATRVVRPALRCSGIQTRFENLQGIWGDAVAVPQSVEQKKAVIPPYYSDSFVADIQEKATGFFYTKKLSDGRWWVIDPKGRGFVMFGVDHCTYHGHNCEALGKQLHREANDKLFKNHEEWAAKTVGLLKAWGFNLLTASISPEITHRGLAHAGFVGLGGYFASIDEEFAIIKGNGNPCSMFPNVFHPEFRDFCQYQLEIHCRDHVDDPWLFGYFIDNELLWWGGTNAIAGLFDATMKKTPTHTAKLRLRDLLKEKANGDIAVFNRQWNQQLKSFDDILTLEALPHKTPEQMKLKQDYLALCADTYFRIISEEYRKIDKNHMLMGCRFAGISAHDEVVWRAAGKYCDLLTWNHYGYVDLDLEAAYEGKPPKGKPLTESFSQVYEWANRPCAITEWSFPALDAGLPSTNGAGQRFYTQKERAKATGIYAKTMLSMPFMVGYDYFMWVDEPKLGISKQFPENSNYGLISEEYKIYEEVVAEFTAIQKEDPARYRRAPLTPPKGNPNKGTGAVYDRYATSVKAWQATPRHADLDFGMANGQVAWASNGTILLKQQVGGAGFEVFKDGEKYGDFNVMLYYLNQNGDRTWTNVSILDASDVKANGDELVITCRAHKGIEAVDKKFDAVSDRQFEMTYRIMMRPKQDWFLSEILTVKNLHATDPLTIKGVYLRLYPVFQPLDTKAQPVPNLWNGNRLCCWQEPGDKRYMGVTATRYQDIELRYWITPEDNYCHPDAWRDLRLQLNPGEAYSFHDPFYVLNYFGKGDLKAIETHESRLSLMEFETK